MKAKGALLCKERPMMLIIVVRHLLTKKNVQINDWGNAVRNIDANKRVNAHKSMNFSIPEKQPRNPFRYFSVR